MGAIGQSEQWESWMGAIGHGGEAEGSVASGDVWGSTVHSVQWII